MAATQSLDISQYHKALEKRPINPENEKLLQELTSTDGGKAWVADHLASLISVPRPTLSGWAKSVTSIQATNYGGITYMKVNVRPRHIMAFKLDLILANCCDLCRLTSTVLEV